MYKEKLSVILFCVKTVTWQIYNVVVCSAGILCLLICNICMKMNFLVIIPLYMTKKPKTALL